MSIYFNAKDHSYKSLEAEEKIDWISVTTLVSHFKKPFDAKKIAEKVSKNKRSKWFGIEPKRIQEIWEAEADFTKICPYRGEVIHEVPSQLVTNAKDHGLWQDFILWGARYQGIPEADLHGRGNTRRCIGY